MDNKKLVNIALLIMVSAGSLSIAIYGGAALLELDKDNHVSIPLLLGVIGIFTLISLWGNLIGYVAIYIDKKIDDREIAKVLGCNDVIKKIKRYAKDSRYSDIRVECSTIYYMKVSAIVPSLKFPDRLTITYEITWVRSEIDKRGCDSVAKDIIDRLTNELDKYEPTNKQTK